MDVKELRAEIDSGRHLQLVDVRGPDEFAAGHVPGAVNVPVEQIESRLEDLGKSGQIVLICHSGDRAQMACELIQQHHPELEVLEGGTVAWIDAGLPVVRTTRTRWALERQTRLGAGILVLTGTILSLTVHPNWIYLAVFVGAGLTFAGATDICLMGIVFRRMPWNKPRIASTQVEPART
jgi:rhodanese-related sulfurtransferase